MATRFEPTEKTRLRRRPQRGSYDADAIFAILDAAAIAHLGYVVDGQPFCTPTAYWREGDRLYWHGSAASRMIQAQAAGIPVCLTVTHVDGLVLGRSGFTHSILYRSVMAFGHPALVADEVEKRHAMDAFIERLHPGRTREIRPPTDGELEAISVLGMAIEEASAKVRDGGVIDADTDLGAPCWAGVVPLATTVGAPVPDARLAPGVALPPALAGYAPHARWDAVLAGSATKAKRY
jgi:nitroimidazol reductase NimA-like FMN-containing flavoprotein (pyridoxamine 5'-phosphate oxidase superfamily)